MNTLEPQNSDRLLSLDFYRGLTMFLLIAEFSHLFSYMTSSELEGTIIHAIGQQFHHVRWEGLHFWDLIQPFFMFIVGVAMPLSFTKRRAKGDSESKIRMHVFKRAFLLLLLGWALYCIDPGKIVFRHRAPQPYIFISVFFNAFGSCSVHIDPRAFFRIKNLL